MNKYCPKCFKKYQSETVRCPDDGTNLVTLEDRDLTGQVLDERYTVLGRIGKGGMGVVYRAEQQLIKRVVALKVLRSEVVQDESSVKRFLVEAQAIASLTSRFTVTLHDFGVSREGLLYYTMEFLKGRALSRVIQEDAPLKYGRAARLVLQVCDSLEEAHERGILHRDIKPDNLFVERDRQGEEEIRVLDFGIAKLVGDSSMGSVTGTGLVVGTPQYLSPEQALGTPCVPASDLYSLGIVLYEMLAGAAPFGGDTPMKMLWAHIQSPVPRLQVTNPDVEVPKSIEAFLSKALEKNPLNRFQSATEFKEALKKALINYQTTNELAILRPMVTTGQGLRERVASQAQEPLVAGDEGDPGAALAETTIQVSAGHGAIPAEVPSTAALEHSVAKQRHRLAWGLGIAAFVALAALGVVLMGPWATGDQSAGGRLEAPGAGAPASVSEGAEGSRPVEKGSTGEATVAVIGEPVEAREQQPDVAGPAATDQAVQAARKRDELGAAAATTDALAKAVADEEARRKAEADEAAKERDVREAAAKEAAAKKAAEEEAAKLVAAEEAKRKAEAISAAKAADEAAKRAAQQEAQRKKKEQEAQKKREEEARQRKIRDLKNQGSQAQKARQWKQCVGYFEEVVRLGGSTPEVVEKLEKCRQMQTFDGGELR